MRNGQSNKINMTRDCSGSSESDTCAVVKVRKPPTTTQFYYSFSFKVAFFTEEEMENRARLKVQKKRPIKRSGRKVLLKNVLDYLKADTYMYAPLLSPPTSDFPSPNAFPSSAKGLTLTLPFFFLYILVSIAVAFSFLVSFDEVVVACL